ncbi:MAG: OB-fold nucleic acid binding domain-containing protein, partial [Candidatus Heimdallarchaeaceae archaeon]
MKIVDVKKLDDGISGITIEGRITKTPRAPKESQYGWSQFIIIKDDTEEIGSNINIENAEDAYKVGQYIQIKGKVSKYMKGKYPNVSLNGNVLDEIVKEEKEEDVSQEKPKDNTQPVEQPGQIFMSKDDYWREKALRDIENNKCIVRECAIKAVSEEAVINLFNIVDEKQYFGIADKIVDYINNEEYLEVLKNNKEITTEAITKEFGGTTEEEKPQDSGGRIYTGSIEKPKEQKIAQAKELVRNPHLTEPVNDKMATIEQKKQIYGYINEEGKKMGGIVDSQYIKKEEVKSIGKAQDLTKADGIRYWEYWYGKEGELGERKKRELEAKDTEGTPFTPKRNPLEKK